MYEVPVDRPITAQRWWVHVPLLTGIALLWWSLWQPWDTGQYHLAPSGRMEPIMALGVTWLPAQLLLGASVLIGGLWGAMQWQQPWTPALLRRLLPLVACMPLLVFWYGQRLPGVGADDKLWLVSVAWLLIAVALYAHHRPPRPRSDRTSDR